MFSQAADFDPREAVTHRRYSGLAPVFGHQTPMHSATADKPSLPLTLAPAPSRVNRGRFGSLEPTSHDGNVRPRPSELFCASPTHALARARHDDDLPLIVHEISVSPRR